jgi:phosphate:Na+ symporter
MRARERDLRESHLGRLRAGLAESLETSEIHLDILTNLKRVSSHVRLMKQTFTNSSALTYALPTLLRPLAAYSPQRSTRSVP